MFVYVGYISFVFMINVINALYVIVYVRCLMICGVCYILQKSIVC